MSRLTLPTGADRFSARCETLAAELRNRWGCEVNDEPDPFFCEVVFPWPVGRYVFRTPEAFLGFGTGLDVMRKLARQWLAD